MTSSSPLTATVSVPQDLVQAFTVHVPNTNVSVPPLSLAFWSLLTPQFPPAEDHAYMRSQDGRDSQVSTEPPVCESH